jgi:hypothetical protein
METVASSVNPVRELMRTIEEEERDRYEGSGRVRPAEDEELVGREAAEEARRERLGAWGREVLVREDRRWDWLLGEFAVLFRAVFYPLPWL